MPTTWTRFVSRSTLEHGRTFVHGSARLNIAEPDLAAFVDPPDAELALGFRALADGDPFERSFPVWMATFRRWEGEDAMMESLQRVFTQLADEGSLAALMVELYRRAGALGYRRLYFSGRMFQEPLLAPAIKQLVDAVGRPIQITPTNRLASIALA